MTDDIRLLLREAAAHSGPAPDFASLAAARQRRERLLASLGTATAVLVAVALLGPWVGRPTSGPIIGEPAGNDPTPSSSADLAPALGPGWTDVEVGDARFGVPADWSVKQTHPSDDNCPGFGVGSVVEVYDESVPPHGNIVACALMPTRPWMLAVPLSLDVYAYEEYTGARSHLDWLAMVPTTGAPVTVNGIAGERYDRHVGESALRQLNEGYVAYRFPEVDLLLYFNDVGWGGPAVDQFMDTILSTLAPRDMPRADGPSDLLPLVDLRSLTATAPLQPDLSVVLGLLEWQPWHPHHAQHPEGETERLGDAPPPFDAGDRDAVHAAVTALANEVWGDGPRGAVFGNRWWYDRFGGSRLDGDTTVVSIVGATDADRDLLDAWLALDPRLAGTPVEVVAAERSVTELEVLREAGVDG